MKDHVEHTWKHVRDRVKHCHHWTHFVNMSRNSAVISFVHREATSVLCASVEAEEEGTKEASQKELHTSQQAKNRR